MIICYVPVVSLRCGKIISNIYCLLDYTALQILYFDLCHGWERENTNTINGSVHAQLRNIMENYSFYSRVPEKNPKLLLQWGKINDLKFMENEKLSSMEGAIPQGTFFLVRSVYSQRTASSDETKMLDECFIERIPVCIFVVTCKRKINISNQVNNNAKWQRQTSFRFNIWSISCKMSPEINKERKGFQLTNEAMRTIYIFIIFIYDIYILYLYLYKESETGKDY